jgi:polysaccharide chain length determinant protein (PEP-CTERM system associated)
MEQEFKIFQEYAVIIKRYKNHMLAIAAIGFILSAIVAYRIPSMYTSTATILIENQEMPDDIVRSMVSNYAEQRIQIINQKIMSSKNLTTIINKFDLYPEERKVKSLSSIVDSMRENISMNTVGGKQIVDPRSGKIIQPTLAYTLSFSSKLPEAALKVTNELVDLYLDENKKQRMKVVEKTAKFLKQEAKKSREEIDKLEDELTDFKEKHAKNLPEQSQINNSRMERTELRIDEFTRQISSLTESEMFLESQLNELAPTPLALGKEKLAELKTEYSKLSSKYSKDHPDLKKLKWEIANLKKTLRERPEDLESETIQIQLNSPEYIQLKARLFASQAELRGIRNSRETLRNKLIEYEERAAGAPRIERQYQSLMREHVNTTLRYRELKAKLRDANMSQSMELDKQGNEFSLLEPPLLPETHSKPNRPAIMFLGLLGSIVTAFGFLMVKEGIKPRIYTSGRLASVIGITPLISIPHLKPKQGWSKKQLLFILGGLLVVAMAWYAISLLLETD